MDNIRHSGKISRPRAHAGKIARSVNVGRQANFGKSSTVNPTFIGFEETLGYWSVQFLYVYTPALKKCVRVGILVYICPPFRPFFRTSVRPFFRNSVTLFHQRFLHNLAS